MTTSLSSSLDLLSLTTSTRWASDSPSDEDEIVWSLSSSAHLSTSPPLYSPLSETGDFVLVPRATAASSVSPTADTVADQLAALSLTPAAHAGPPAAPSSSSTPQRTTIQRPTRAKEAKRQQQSRRQQAPTTASPAAPRGKSKKKATKRTQGGSSASSASSPTGVAASSSSGARAAVSVKDSLSEASEAEAPVAYQEAHKYMTSCVTIFEIHFSHLISTPTHPPSALAPLLSRIQVPRTSATSGK